MDDPKRVVAGGYDEMAPRYVAWAARIRDQARTDLMDALSSRLAPGSRVLDLGSGSGVPTARELARRHAVTGIDISQAQVELARANVPEATFVVGDLASADFDPASFDAVVALYSITHVPRDEHAAVFARIARWLRPGGWLAATLGASDDPGWRGMWLGVEMFFSSWDVETNRRLLHEAGFELVVDEVRAIAEPEGKVDFHWVLARRR
jgi:SAM-dependent methyltransferase